MTDSLLSRRTKRSRAYEIWLATSPHRKCRDAHSCKGPGCVFVSGKTRKKRNERGKRKVAR